MHKKPLLDVFYQDYSNASQRYAAARKVHNWMRSNALAKEFYHSNDDTAAAESNGCWFIARRRRGHLISMYSGIVLITQSTYPMSLARLCKCSSRSTARCFLPVNYQREAACVDGYLTTRTCRWVNKWCMCGARDRRRFVWRIVCSQSPQGVSSPFPVEQREARDGVMLIIRAHL